MDNQNQYREDPDLPFGNTLKNADGFKVPADYFENAGPMILAQCVGGTDTNDSKGFGVPQGYFETLPEKLMQKIEIDALKCLPDSDGFKVPENYFESFYDRLSSRLKRKTIQTSTRVIQMKKLWYYAAAACLFTAVGLFAIKWSQQNESTTLFFAECSDEELLEYVTTYADDFDQELIASLIEETDLDVLDVMGELDESTEDLLIEYLE